jgi:hypothetical protein
MMYKSQADLADHLKVVQLISSVRTTGTVFIGRHLLETLVLSQYALVINTQHKLLLCLSCTTAVIPSQLKSHLNKQHSGVKLAENDRQAIVQLLMLFHIDISTLPELHHGIVSEIEGLPVIEGHPCPSCVTTSLTYESLKAHMRKNHKGVTYPHETDQVFVQQLKIGTHNQPIRIHVSEELPSRFSTADILNQATDILNSANLSLPEAPSNDPRDLCPWLRHVRWQDLTVGKNVQELVALVAHPKANEFDLLSDGLLFLLGHASSLLSSTPELILQRLNSPRMYDE